jgi:hypothetical protein
MDPNANLTEMRELAQTLLDNNADLSDFCAQAERLAELVQALDEWLTRGGFLPRDWKR